MVALNSTLRLCNGDAIGWEQDLGEFNVNTQPLYSDL